MRDLYIDSINKFIESVQMKKYLVENVDILQKWQIIDLICGARASLTDKYEMLKKLSEKETDEDKEERNSATSAAKNAKSALEELVLNSGEVFLKMECGYDYEIKEKKLYGAEPCFSLEPVMRYINEEYTELEEDEKKDAVYWYELEKYVPDDVEKLDNSYAYTIAPNGEIWFVEKEYLRYGDFASSQDLNLPVPFEIGDIITIDCRPFAPLKHAVIVKIGDNWGCCSVQCMWVDNDGDIYGGALKHSSVFDDKTFILVSPLYRAEVYEGELSEKEACLKDISKHVYRDEEKGRALWMYSYENEKSNGMSYEMIKDYIDKAENGGDQ